MGTLWKNRHREVAMRNLRKQHIAIGVSFVSIESGAASSCMELFTVFSPKFLPILQWALCDDDVRYTE